MGSVKNLEILEEPTEKRMGLGRFVFSDRYSVFDWGGMPDTIPHKGAALCVMGAYCFEKAEERGINTHYRGLVNNEGEAVGTEELEEPLNVMEVKIARVIKPEFCGGEYDYSMFTSDLVNFLLPLEVIYRNGLPEGSSVFRRLKKGKVTPEDLGLEEMPRPGQKFEEPILDVSTKLEEKDRYITWDEAQRIAGISDSETHRIKDILKKANDIITEVAKKAGLVNEDGKIELVFGPDREPMLADVLGTLDECRFTYEGLNVSKEIARQYYKGTDWEKEVREAQDEAQEKGIENWKELCDLEPPRLDPNLKRIVSQMYTSTANAFLGRRLFDVPDLKKVMEEHRSFKESV